MQKNAPFYNNQFATLITNLITKNESQSRRLGYSTVKLLTGNKSVSDLQKFETVL